MPQHFLDRRDVANKEVACIVSKRLVSCLWVCGEFGGLCPLDQRETQIRYPFFKELFILSNHTPEDVPSPPSQNQTSFKIHLVFFHVITSGTHPPPPPLEQEVFIT